MQCELCRRDFKVITNTHLQREHGISIRNYTERFGKDGVGFALSFWDLPKSDPRYQYWREHLKGRQVWIRGKTKENDPRVRKISETFKTKGIDNFAAWRAWAKRVGKIKQEYRPFKQDGDLAELIGAILGDGHIAAFPRTERLVIAASANNPGFIERYRSLIQQTFEREPSCKKMKHHECVRIGLYEKCISKRLGVPTGDKRRMAFELPVWIRDDQNHLLRFLRGLYEAEGCFCVHRPTSTYKIIFNNRNESLLQIVHTALRHLGFHTHRSQYKVQLSRRDEVYRFKELIQFRHYAG